MTRPTRNKSSLINTHKILNFVFNGKKYKGFEGDTLASALLANEVKLILNPSPKLLILFKILSNEMLSLVPLRLVTVSS